MNMQNQSIVLPPKINALVLRLWNFDRGHSWLLLLFLLIQTSPLATAQLRAAPSGPNDNRSVIAIMVIVVVMFLISGLFSLYTRHCSDRQIRIGGRLDLTDLPIGGSSRRSHGESSGLDKEVIETFPTFLYSSVQGFKIGTSTLLCAVCLNEFQDDETLRLIPKCNHVFHPSCIDVWLASRSTCPVCRAHIVPIDEAKHVPPPPVFIQIPNDHEEQESNEEILIDTMNQNRLPRSRSMGFLFPRSNSTGHLVTMHGENCERFTLKLPEEVRSQLINSTLKRTNSCMSFTRMSSGKKGFRTRSVGSGRGRNYLQYERFCNEQHLGFQYGTVFGSKRLGRIE